MKKLMKKTILKKGVQNLRTFAIDLRFAALFVFLLRYPHLLKGSLCWKINKLSEKAYKWQLFLKPFKKRLENSALTFLKQK